MAYYTSIGYGTAIWNNEEYLEIFQGNPEIGIKNQPNHNERINPRKNKTHRITTRKEHGIQGKEHTEGKSNDRKTPFHGTMVDHGWNLVIFILPDFEALGCTESAGPVLHILCPLLLILDASRMSDQRKIPLHYFYH
jgi:hypothetical protein